MKVLMFGWEFPPFNSGGLGVACFGLVRALSELGISVDFVLPKKLKANMPNVHFTYAEDFIGPLQILEWNSLLRPYVTSDIYSKERSGIPDRLYGYGLLDEV